MIFRVNKLIYQRVNSSGKHQPKRTMTCKSAGSEVLDQLEAEGKLLKGSWRLGLMLLSGGLEWDHQGISYVKKTGISLPIMGKSLYSTNQNGDFSRGSNGITM